MRAGGVGVKTSSFSWFAKKSGPVGEETTGPVRRAGREVG
jgi:hypothetical protein